MTKVFRCITCAAAAIAVPVVVFFLALVVVPSLRHTVYRIVAELPAVGTNFIIRGSVRDRNYAAVAAGLDRQLRLSQWLDAGRSVLIPGLIENTEFAVERLRLAPEQQALLPFLEDLVEDQPDIYDARIWLARALLAADPRAAFPHLERAAQLVPADERAYRVAIEVALALNEVEEAQVWCGRYYEARLGGPDPFRYRNVFWGTGLRKVALEVPGADGPILIGNEGIEVGERRTYDFAIPERVSPDRIVLHFGFLPGVQIGIDSVVLYGPETTRVHGGDDVVITSLRGYVLPDKSIITDSEDGEVVILRPLAEAFGPLDRIDIVMSIRRLSLSSLDGCEELR